MLPVCLGPKPCLQDSLHRARRRSRSQGEPDASSCRHKQMLYAPDVNVLAMLKAHMISAHTMILGSCTQGWPRNMLSLVAQDEWGLTFVKGAADPEGKRPDLPSSKGLLFPCEATIQVATRAPSAPMPPLMTTLSNTAMPLPMS